MNTSAAALIDFDWNTFDPWRIQAVRHLLSDHPLMNDVLYRKSIKPVPVGKRPLVDALTYVTASALVAAHGIGSPPPACPSLAHPSAYAIAD